MRVAPVAREVGDDDMAEAATLLADRPGKNAVVFPVFVGVRAFPLLPSFLCCKADGIVEIFRFV